MLFALKNQYAEQKTILHAVKHCIKLVRLQLLTNVAKQNVANL